MPYKTQYVRFTGPKTQHVQFTGSIRPSMFDSQARDQVCTNHGSIRSSEYDSQPDKTQCLRFSGSTRPRFTIHSMIRPSVYDSHRNRQKCYSKKKIKFVCSRSAFKTLSQEIKLKCNSQHHTNVIFNRKLINYILKMDLFRHAQRRIHTHTCMCAFMCSWVCDWCMFRCALA